MWEVAGLGLFQTAKLQNPNPKEPFLVNPYPCVRACVPACLRACVRACVCACVCACLRSLPRLI
jgi:hypothetical protein